MREGGGRGAKRGRSDGSSVMYGVILPVVTHTHEPLRAFHAEPRPLPLTPHFRCLCGKSGGKGREFGVEEGGEMWKEWLVQISRLSV